MYKIFIYYLNKADVSGKSRAWDSSLIITTENADGKSFKNKKSSAKKKKGGEKWMKTGENLWII